MSGGGFLASVLNQRRWQVCTRPFPHIVARDVFTPDFYAELDFAFGAFLERGLSEDHDPARLSRNIRNYDAYSVSFAYDMPKPFQLFISREWHDMLAQLAGVPATTDVSGGFHHHLRGSRSGEVHNDLNPGWFVDAAPNGAVNLTRNDLCDYTTGHRRDPRTPTHQAVRAVAVLFYLQNAHWREGDGGETGLYADRDQPVDAPDKAIPPVNNTLLMFECRPNSYHSFIQNRAAPRNSMIMWLHRPLGEAAQRWGERDRRLLRGRASGSRIMETGRKVCLLTGAAACLARRSAACSAPTTASWQRSAGGCPRSFRRSSGGSTRSTP